METFDEITDDDPNNTYPDPLSIYESALARKQRKIETIKRVLAPYIMQRKTESIPKENDSYFTPFLHKRPSLLMSDMAKLLADGVEITTVLMDTANVLTDVTRSTVVTVYLVDDSLEEIYQIDRNYVDRKHAISYKIELGTTVAAHVAYKKEYVKVDDILEDVRFPDALGSHEITMKSVLCVPVLTHENECLAVFELYRNMDMPVYNDVDLQTIVVLTGWVGSALYQNQCRINLQRQHELNDYILSMTNCYFANTMLLDNLISEITHFAKLYLDAEHAMFFVLKKKFDETLADLYEEEIDANPKQMIKKCVKMNLEKDFHFINMAVQEATLINIRNAYRDPRIKQDRRKGYMTRCILCLPILSGTEVIGVFQLINKKHASCFSRNDEILFQSFAIYCSLILSYDREIEKSRSTNYLNTIYLDMMGHHVQPCRHDLAVYLHDNPILLPQKFNEFEFHPTKEMEPELPYYVVGMFRELSVNIRQEHSTPIKFVLSVKNSYRDNPYHNFDHAFSVCHCMYNMLRRNMDAFTPVEIKSLMVASLCHDIDHIGLTNNYLDITDHALARLYKESPMENHHVNVTRFITRHYELFNNSSEEEINLIMKEMREAILATDLSDYFMRRGRLNKIVDQNQFDWTNQEHRMLLKSLMMTTADLSGSCKPFRVAKSLAKQIYKEFYNEGDQEKFMNLSPLTIMNREKRVSIQNDQIQFLNIVVLPCILMLTKFFPNCANLYRNAMHVRNSWETELKNPPKKEVVREFDIGTRLMRFDVDEETLQENDAESQ